MSTTVLNKLGERISLEEAVSLVIAMGSDANLMLRGEKGIGKSSMMGMLRERLGDGYHYCYYDMGAKGEGDVGIPFPSAPDGEGKRFLEWLASEEFGLHTGLPLVVMLDEFTKAPRSVQNMVHPMLEQHNRRILGKSLPAKSIIILTGNLTEEGLNDNLFEHTKDRIVEVEVAKPDAKQWLMWGVQNDIHPAVLAFVDRTPQVMASFRDPDFDHDNSYVYNPRRAGAGKYCTPRSLVQASRIVWQKDQISDNAFRAALIGAVGGPTAAGLHDYIAFSEDLPSPDEIIKTPEKARIPDSAGARVVLLFALERRIDADTIDPIMQYVERLGAEQMMIMCSTLSRSATKSVVAAKNKRFTHWLVENADLI